MNFPNFRITQETNKLLLIIHKIVALIIIALFPIRTVTSQELLIVPKPAMVIEIGGAGGYASLNYEHPVQQFHKTTITIRAGISTYHLNDFYRHFNPDLIVPLSVRAYIGKIHQLELGAGQVFTSVVIANAEEIKKVRKQNLHSQFALGYRFAPSGKRWMTGVSYTPLIEHSHGLRHWAAISFSYLIHAK